MSRKIIAPEWVVKDYPFPSDIEITFSEDAMTLPHEVLNASDFTILPYLANPDEAKYALSHVKSGSVFQLLTAGFDNVLPHIPEGVTLCNAAGVHDDSTAEMALSLTLATLREIPKSVHLQAKNEWGHGFSHALADKKVLLIGYGGVGKATESRLLPFKCEVTVVATHARDHVHAISELPTLIPSADVIILTVPLNDGTRGLVDQQFLALMKPGALLVNVARGPVVVTKALIEALKSGKIMAALDVTDPEPLPADHPLWQAPNCLITPHLGGDTDIFERRAIKRIHSQLDLWLNGKPLECVITK